MKILIIGLGSIGKKHVIAIKSFRLHIEIFALRSQRGADKYSGVTNIYNLNNVELSDFNFSIISNPTSEHKKTIEKLIHYRIPLFIEKPIYSSLDIEDVINSIVSKEINTYVACNLRFLDCIRFIKEKLQRQQRKRLNEVNVYCGSYLPDWRLDTDFRKTYSANIELGGGVHIDLIHELDYLYWFFGMPNNVNRIVKSGSSIAISAIDYANYVLDYDDFCASVVLNYYRIDPKRSLELVFEDETWNVDLLKNQVICNNQVIFTSKQQIADTYQPQMEYFINSLDQKTSAFNTISDGYNVLKICLGQ